MKQYKHYSFDVWLTLIKSNPDFKAKRNEYFFNHFNRQKKTLEEVSTVIKDIDVMCNKINETVGRSIHPFEMIGMILSKLEYPMDGLQMRDILAIHHWIQQAFLSKPPSWYSLDTFRVIKELKQRGCSISLGSNTGFIVGSTLDKFFKQFGRDLFNFAVYSDSIGVSKPNVLFFGEIFKLVNVYRLMTTKATIEEVVHIGDNPLADIMGAKEFGFDTMQINSNNLAIANII